MNNAPSTMTERSHLMQSAPSRRVTLDNRPPLDNEIVIFNRHGRVTLPTGPAHLPKEARSLAFESTLAGLAAGLMIGLVGAVLLSNAGGMISLLAAVAFLVSAISGTTAGAAHGLWRVHQRYEQLYALAPLMVRVAPEHLSREVPVQ